MKSTLISFDGIDGAGKTSHIQATVAALEAAGHQVVVTREPGGTALGEKLRDMVLHEPMDAMTEAFLVFAARREHILQVIAPALRAGKIVVCDRFTDATFAYQGAGRGFDLKTLSTLETWAQSLQGLGLANCPRIPSHLGLLQPSLTFLFDLDPEIAAKRLLGARQADRFEAQDLAFFQRVREGYRARCHEQPMRFSVVDASQEASKVSEHVMDALKAKGLLEPQSKESQTDSDRPR